MAEPFVHRPIPFFDYPALFRADSAELMGILKDVIERGAFILQQDLCEFEGHLAAFVGVPHALGVANGTDALTLALMATDLEPGGEVLMPSHTYVASAMAIHFAGGTPVLVDCGHDHMMSPESAEAAVTSRTRAIMPVQLNGRTVDMDAVEGIAKRASLTVIEDAAQGLGARFRGRAAGTFGAAAAFSFYPAKVLGCAGDGGAITTSDPDIARRVRALRNHGRSADGEVATWGMNSRLDNLQAAILDFKLKNLLQTIERRRHLARRYHEALRDLEDLVLPPGPDDEEDRFDVYQNYEVESSRRDELRTHLRRDGVETVIQWGGKPVHQMSTLTARHPPLPATDRLFQRCFLLPMNLSLSDGDVEYICDSTRRFYGRAG